MIIKKAFVTTSSFILSAVLLSQFYAFESERFEAKKINYSAFINLAENIKTISSASENETTKEVTVVTNDIIKVIDKEITSKIKKSRYSILEKKIAKKTIIAKASKKATAEVAESVAPAATIMNAENLSSFEINNKELINLYALDVEKMEYSKFERIALNTSYNEEIKDEVVTGQASTEAAPIEADEVKTIQPAAKREEIAEEVKEVKEDEMVMFDYSDKKSEAIISAKPMDKKLYERPISNTVKAAINREIGSTPIKRIIPVDTQKTTLEEPVKVDDKEIDLNSDQNIVYDYTNERKASIKTKAEEASFLAPTEEVSTHRVQYIIRAKEINLNTQKMKQAHSFEFVPDYDRAERADDQSNGEISLGYSLSGEMNTQTGVVQAHGLIPTRVELNLGAAKGLEIPLINEEGIQAFLQKQGLAAEGNLLMIALNSSIVDTEIDSKFNHRFFFDRNFKTLSAINGASYVMYAGVKTGNILIRYLLDNKESSQKIVYVGDGEMYFEDPKFINGERETFTFTTRNLLGHKKKELVIDGGAISFFNTNNIAKKKALNAYEIKVPSLASGMRKYFEFKHLNDSVFVGSWNEKDIEIPGNEFIAKVMEENQVNSLKERCMVQINLSKDLSSITANGKNRSGEMFVETSFLDKDGAFSRDNAEKAEKAFLVGDMEGLLSVKLNYEDGSTEFLKTFCSEGSYLIEQL